VRVLAFHHCGLGFSPPWKTNISKFQFDQDRGPAWKPAKADVASCLNIIIILIYLLALPFGVTTETLATQDPDREDEETDTPIFEKHDAMLHGQRKDRK